MFAFRDGTLAPCMQLMDILKSKIPKSILTYGLVCTFGIGSWIAVNGIWAEMPILVNSTPECYKLPAVLVVTIQLANVGLLLYVGIRYCLHRCKVQAKIHLEVGTILILIVTGILSCVFLALFWNRTLFLFDELHSVSLFILTFFLSLVDCTSSIVFVPFMKNFPPEYLSALYIGEGLSGLLPSLFAFSQGSVNNSISCSSNYTGHEALGIRFSPSVYFIFLGGMMLLCGGAFVAIITIPTVRKHMVNGTWKESQAHVQTRTCHKDTLYSPRNVNQSGSESEDDSQIDENKEIVQDGKLHFSLTNICRLFWSNSALYICLIILTFLTNGALNAVSSFAFRPYENSVYHTAINLALVANPLMSFVFFVLPSKSKIVTVVTTVIICVLGIYVLVMAQSPAPTFQTSTFAEIIIVSFLVYIIIRGIGQYVYIMWDVCRTQ